VRAEGVVVYERGAPIEGGSENPQGSSSKLASGDGLSRTRWRQRYR
jgi:hypothetical protein